MSFSFNNIQEFRKFVYHLKDADIRNFSYTTWNELYKGIDDLYKKLKIEENIDRLKQEYKQENKDCDVDNLSGTIFFSNCLCPDEFIKLNLNIKLDRKDWQYSANIAKKIAKDICYNGVDLANVLFSKKNKEDMIKTIDKSSLDATNYASKYEDAFNFMLSNVEVLENEYSSSKGYAKYRAFNTDIVISDMTDSILSTSAHEATHAHFQQNTSLQEHLKANNDLPFGLDKNLSNLFENNQKFYIIADGGKGYTNNFLGYSRQPIEYFAKLVGYLTEREFRKITKQYSERNLILLNNHFTQHLNIENPISAKYNKDMIEVFYPISSFRKINRFRKGLSPELKEKIKFYKSKTLVKVAIKRGYNTRTELLKHIKKKEKTKLIQTSLRNSALKKVPILGIGVGAYLGIKRLLQKDNILAGAEFFSGALSTMSKEYGLIYGFGIDFTIYCYDNLYIDVSKGFASDVIYKKAQEQKFDTLLKQLKIKKER